MRAMLRHLGRAIQGTGFLFLVGFSVTAGAMAAFYLSNLVAAALAYALMRVYLL